MKLIFFLALLSSLGYGYWYYSHQVKSPALPASLSSSSKISLDTSKNNFANLEKVLGASIEKGVGTVTELLSTATDGKTDPIINRAISNFQNELKALPEDQMKKIQYNYCKGIVEEYERK